MQFSVKTGTPTSIKTECAIVPLFDGARLAGVTRRFDKSSRGRIGGAVRAGDASGKPGRTLLLRDVPGSSAASILLVGCGAGNELDNKRLALAHASAAAALADTGIRNAVSFLGYDHDGALGTYSAARTAVQTLRSANYRFTELKSKAEPKPKLARVGIALPDKADAAEARRGIKHGRAIADGMDLARDLGNRPANVCTPTHLASVAKELAKTHAKLDTKVLQERDMKRLGMGALLSVTQGAGEPARLVVMEYKGASARDKPVAICGKGITFDTGGISMKPPPKMDEMKFDMCGAAGVVGTMRAIAELELPINVVGIVPTCENMPGSHATRPGDIVTSMSGLTIEILNTDAEGRLILSDALTYAQQQYEPRCIIDVATLTGACVIALGPLYTGLFSQNAELADALVAAGERALDEVWPLPMDEEYGESLRSNFADLANSGSREGGASIAAHFLSRFVGATPWAHLDIAGVAWRVNAAKGATGRPVPLLVDYLLTVAS